MEFHHQSKLVGRQLGLHFIIDPSVRHTLLTPDPGRLQLGQKKDKRTETKGEFHSGHKHRPNETALALLPGMPLFLMTHMPSRSQRDRVGLETRVRRDSTDDVGCASLVCVGIRASTLQTAHHIPACARRYMSRVKQQ